MDQSRTQQILRLSLTDDGLTVGKLKVVLEDGIEGGRVLGLRDDHRGHLDGIEMSLHDMCSFLVCVVVLLHGRRVTLVHDQRLHRSDVEWSCQGAYDRGREDQNGW